MKELWKGNEAMAEAAVRAGCELYAGYPITPQSEICEYMSHRMPELGRAFIQAESELISINTVMGGSLAGARCMTSSTGVGISLMQEGLTACFAKGICPMLINVNRCGCGMGAQFTGSQDDYSRETRGGGNGYYRLLVYVPESIQEAVDMVYAGWDIAEKYRNPVEVYTEGRLGQMMEAVELPPFKNAPPRPDWAMDGTSKPMPDYYPMLPDHSVYLRRIRAMEENEQQWEEFHTEDAETILVAVGLTARVCKSVVLNLRAQGIKIGLLRPKTIWPFPKKGFAALPDTVQRLICVENSIGAEMLDDVLITAKALPQFRLTPVYSSTHIELISGKELTEFIHGVLNGEIEEVH